MLVRVNLCNLLVGVNLCNLLVGVSVPRPTVTKPILGVNAFRDPVDWCRSLAGGYTKLSANEACNDFNHSRLLPLRGWKAKSVQPVKCPGTMEVGGVWVGGGGGGYR